MPAATYEAGSAYITLLPSARGFHRKVREELSRVPDAQVELEPQARGFRQKVAAAVRGTTAQVHVELNKASAAKAQAEVEALGRKLANVHDAEKNALGQVRVEQAKLDAVRANSKATTAQVIAAEERLAAAQRKAGSAGRDAAFTAQSLQNAQDRLAAATRNAESATSGFASSLGRLRGSSGVFNDLDRGAGRLVGSLFRTVGATGAVAGGLGAIGGAIPIIANTAAAVGTLAGALLALPGAAAGGAAALATLAVGTSGVGDAFKELFKDQTAAGASAGSAAKQQSQAAEQIRSAKLRLRDAEEGLRDTQRQASRDAIEAARRVREAEIGVADARAQAARDAQTAARQVVEANREVTRAQRDLNEAWKEGRRSLQDLQFQVTGGALAQQRAVLALQDATAAYNKVRADPAATQRERTEARLSYEEAKLALDELRVRNQRLRADKAAADRAGVAGTDQVVAAQERLNTATQSQRDAVAAQTLQRQQSARAITDAENQVRRAVADQAEQQYQSSRAITQAQRQVSEAQHDLTKALQGTATAAGGASNKLAELLGKLSPNARAAVEAVRTLKSEYQGLARAVQQRLFAGLADDILRIGRQYLPVLKQGMTGVAESFNVAAKEALAFAGEAQTVADTGRLFSNVKTAVSVLGRALKPVLRGLRDVTAVGSDYLPTFALWVERIGQRFATWASGARAFGELKRRIDEGIQAGKDLFAVFRNVGDILNSVFKASRADSDGFLSSLRQSTAETARFLRSGDGQTRLNQTFSTLRSIVDNLRPGVRDLFGAMSKGALGVGSHLPQIASAFSDLLSAASRLLPVIGNLVAPFITAQFGTLRVVIEAVANVLNGLLPVLRPIAGILGSMSGILLGLGLAWKLLVSPVSRVVGLMRDFAPASFSRRLTESTQRMQGLGDAAAGVGGAVGKAEKPTSRFGKAMGSIVSAGSGVLSALPLVGAAAISLVAAVQNAVGTVDGLADSLRRGGAAAREASQQLKENDRWANSTAERFGGLTSAIGVGGAGLLGGMSRLAPTSKQVADEMRKQWNASTDLQRAQMTLTRAQGDYQLALDKGNANSPAAVAARNKLAQASEWVANAEWRAEQATKTHTQRMQEQNDAILAGQSAKIAYEQGLLRIKTNQDALSTAIATYGRNSTQAKEAQLTLTQSYWDSVTAAGEVARATNSAKSKTVQDTEARKAQNREVVRLVRHLGKDAPQAMRDWIANMTPTEAKAAGLKVTVDNLGRAVVNIPNHPTITLHTKGFAEAARKIGNLIGDMSDLIGAWTLPAPRDPPALIPPSITRKAKGGPVVGPGTGKSDSILALLSNGENVWDAATVRKLGGQSAVERLKELVNSGRLPRFARGGPVRRKKRGTTAASAPQARAATGGGGTAAASDASALAAAGAGLAGTMGALTAQTEGYKQSVVDLSTAALAPLEQQIKTKLNPTFVAAGAQQVRTGQTTRAAWQLTTRRVVANQNQLQTRQTLLGQGMRTSWNNIAVNTRNSVTRQGQSYGVLRGGMNTTQRRQTVLGQGMRQSWANITASTRSSVTNQQRAHAGLQSSMGRVRSAMTATANWAGTQFNRMYHAAANPARRVINAPLAGIVRAWNKIATDFSLRPKVAVPVAGFAQGGKVPGVGNSDTVPALLTPGEYVVPKNVVRKWGLDNIARAHHATLAGDRRGMEGLFSGDTDQLQHVPRFAKGGMVPAINAAVARAIRVAREMNGRPYVWGGASRFGADCSGYQSIIRNALVGESNPYHRAFSTASFAGSGVVGFRPGLKSAYAIGVNPGVHMAGTLAGVNVESSGRVMFGGRAHGADDGQFRKRFYLPFAGGRFVSGGGGGSLNPAAFVDPAFAPVRGQINRLVEAYPGNIVARLGAGIAEKAMTGVKGFANKKLAEALAVSGAGGGVQRWAPIVLRALTIMGQPHSLLQTVLRRMNQESGGDPNIVNNWDSNAAKGTPSVGLMQVIGPTYQSHKHPQFDRGPYIKGTSVDPLSNILASMRYALSEYGSLPAAYNKAGGYRRGGVIPGTGPADSVVLRGTPGERMLTERQNVSFESLARFAESRSFDTLTQLLGRGALNIDTGDATVDGGGALIGSYTQQFYGETSTNGALDEVLFTARKAKRAGLTRG